jgi:hypothetical protein
VALAAVPSSLMLGAITYITTDISAITFFWVIPLALYLLSFILVFLRWPIPWTGAPHKLVVLIEAPVLLWLVYSRTRVGYGIGLLIFINLLAFFLTALTCHGELASDRPSTRHLTEFYLWMSVGGVLGGIFNAIVAPAVFTGIVEYPLALALAGFLRPRLWRSGLVDLALASALPDLVKRPAPAPDGGPGQPRRRIHAPQSAWPEPTPALSYTLDVVLGVGVALVALLCIWWTNDTRNWLNKNRDDYVAGYYLLRYVVPLVLCFFLLGRPLRFGLGFAGIILVHALATGRGQDRTLYADRSYFGVLRVYKLETGDPDPNAPAPLTREEMEQLHTNNPSTWYTYLMHGTTYHGQNYQTPWGLRRLATTYYHRLGPVGPIMDRFNWFKDPINSYHSDSRLPVSVIGAGAAGPVAQLVAAWSEPPYATIGLGTGTMASYAHPYQQITFYDIDQHIVNFSEPPPGREQYFNYLGDAQKRGAKTEIILGDARLSMAEELPDRATFYPKRDHYYHVIVVDAFSSDAIPVHLITEEAIRMYFSKIAEHGVLCVHTSNRHVELIKPVSDIAAALGYKYRVGHDLGDRSQNQTGDKRGLFTSEWIMLTRHEEDLPPNEKDLPMNCSFAEAEYYSYQLRKEGREHLIWYTPAPPQMRLWTDNYAPLLSVFRWRW